MIFNTDRDATVGQHHRDIAQHLARRMRRAALPPDTGHIVECLGDIRRAATSASRRDRHASRHPAPRS